MTSRTFVAIGSHPSAIVRTTISRSVSRPTNLSPSQTTIAPTFCSLIFLAASCNVAPGATTTTSRVRTSLSSMVFLPYLFPYRYRSFWQPGQGTDMAPPCLRHTVFWRQSASVALATPYGCSVNAGQGAR